MFHFLHNKQSGYSLLELVIYIGLFAVIAVVIIRSLVVTMKTYANAQSYRRLQNNGELVMERIVREVRASESVSSGTYNTHPGALTLSQNTSGVEESVGFSVANNKVQVTVEGVTTTLSTDQVQVSNLVFRSFVTPHSSGIKTELTLTTTSAPIVSATFYSTTLLRK